MRRMFTKTLQRSSLFILFLMGACGEDFLPENLLSESRILAVVAEPIEAGFKDNVTLKPVMHLPEGATIVSETWTFCPITLGSNFAFQCVVEACETVVTASETPLGVVSEEPGSRLFDCAINHLAPKASEEEVTSGAEALKEEEDDLPEIVETVFRYRAVIEETLADGSVQEVTRKSLTRIKLHTEEPPTNQNPVVESILVDELEVNLEEIETGITLSGASEKIDVCDNGSCEKSLRPFSFKINVLESSLDSYFNDIDDTDKTEEPDMMFYVTAGRFEAEDSGLIVEGDWTFRSLTEEQEQTLMAGSLEALLYVVVRDGQGGTSAYGPYKFTVEP